jgi:hypothetical protein
MVCGGADHQHLVCLVERHDPRLNAKHGIGAHDPRFIGDAA